jgi:hypothetical protein
MKMTSRSLALAAAFAAGAQPAHSTVFCVHDAADLENALAVASTNGQDDVIRISRGSYDRAEVSRFAYIAPDDETYDLEISGDWYGNCARQGRSATTTVIDGAGLDYAMEIWFPGSFATVRQLTFVGGFAPDLADHGAGLGLLGSGAEPGVVFRIEKNVFVGNEATFGGGLSVTNATIVQVINNVFAANGATADITAADLSSSDGAVYFANNTLVGNGEASNAVWIYSALGAYVVNNNFDDNLSDDDLQIFIPSGETPSNILRNNNITSWYVPGSPILEDNIDVDPEYQSGFLNFTPERSSPLVDAGREPEFLEFWYLVDYDVTGSPRTVGTHVDIGAFENDTLLENGFDPQGPFGFMAGTTAFQTGSRGTWR